MHALVTGAAGFVGSHLAKRLRDDDHDVVGLDSFTDYYDVALKRANADGAVRAGVKFVEADLNEVDLRGVLDGVDVIFHLAGQPGVRSSWGDEFATYTRCNVEATQKLLEASRDSRSLRRLVFASSSSIYGDAERFPTSESDRPQPISPYGVTKLAAEHLCSLYASSFDIPTVSLRYFTVYGPGQRPDMAFTRFAQAAVRGSEITIFGSGEQVRDFTYVDDVVEANVLAATCDVTPGTVLNVAGGSYTSVNEVLDVFRELASTELTVTRVEAMAGDVRRTGGDTAAIRSVLGWRPVVGLREGIERQLKWAAESDLR
ncbi:putative UDP-glucose epimerase YtcB [Mycolicibacterium arabiense]|uniref:Putative UDP-glucose epimerase YtcB n=1 Tax=Mycolicibacterium arabiense TaxID=1286181 RepID=A0A7I7RXL7_9MYCO|nr:NAD-dependent epimerase/dehydratase family protein [Mycolicibacterium arabiense]MCV7374132.1 NAD-dependent epimerase/dehydratase family protein [Mycolicibacterium arabiense]BBY49378.1 putative UDP-glucose epimerase YtcB [Mycolicibacterium arabiense]